MNQPPTLSLFLSPNDSLSHWQKNGLLNRETQIYQRLINDNALAAVYWFTYDHQDHQLQNLLTNIQIIAKPDFFLFKGEWGSLFYSLLLPLLQKKHLKHCHIFKTNQLWGSWTALLCQYLYKKPLYLRTGYTVFLHSQKENKKIWPKIYFLLEKIVRKKAAANTVTSGQQQSLLQQKISTPKPIQVVPNYVDTDLFQPQPLEKNRDAVFVGRLTQQKNLFNLIDAVKQIGCSLDIYGSGPLLDQLSKYAALLKAKVSFSENIPNHQLPQVLNRYQIFILPSFYEGCPKILLEAMACGLACLGTNVTGINEIISHQHTGILVESDSQSLAKGIKLLLKNNQLREKLGVNAREKMVEHYDLKLIIKKEMVIINSII